MKTALTPYDKMKLKDALKENAAKVTADHIDKLIHVKTTRG